jgi:hypothetical protein
MISSSSLLYRKQGNYTASAGWNTSLGIQKTTPPGRSTQIRLPYYQQSAAEMARENRWSDRFMGLNGNLPSSGREGALNVIARGVDPGYDLQHANLYTSMTNPAGPSSFHYNESSTPFKLGVFRPPITEYRDLFSLSRQPHGSTNVDVKFKNDLYQLPVQTPLPLDNIRDGMVVAIDVHQVPLNKNVNFNSWVQPREVINIDHNNSAKGMSSSINVHVDPRYFVERNPVGVNSTASGIQRAVDGKPNVHLSRTIMASIPSRPVGVFSTIVNTPFPEVRKFEGPRHGFVVG